MARGAKASPLFSCTQCGQRHWNGTWIAEQYLDKGIRSYNIRTLEGRRGHNLFRYQSRCLPSGGPNPFSTTERLPVGRKQAANARLVWTYVGATRLPARRVVCTQATVCGNFGTPYGVSGSDVGPTASRFIVISTRHLHHDDRGVEGETEDLDGDSHSGHPLSEYMDQLQN
ncbi:hypothetical protein EXIGLDRAFT_145673 [Exidia glandulosa HHB12029]|uniref:Uncharacterized protein n=1 Tax=Exidia glandulosa HHB12029 TaxID=1314781 RepID=A0A165NDQ1_EXIGL|nr:hypothetical protein EXIGLDRAFT_322531 [Exidia glandulosa HHB12029]KZW00599.1 hypothetical protein EXIGLDRAFT_145673 [Exidia glandulosa HHB12029]